MDLYPSIGRITWDKVGQHFENKNAIIVRHLEYYNGDNLIVFTNKNLGGDMSVTFMNLSLTYLFYQLSVLLGKVTQPSPQSLE